MTKPINTGGPAFPRPLSHDKGDGTHWGDLPEYVPPQDGMTLRDYFAAQALTALIAVYSEGGEINEYDFARWAYAQADAMLKEREVAP